MSHRQTHSHTHTDSHSHTHTHIFYSLIEHIASTVSYHTLLLFAITCRSFHAFPYCSSLSLSLIISFNYLCIFLFLSGLQGNAFPLFPIFISSSDQFYFLCIFLFLSGLQSKVILVTANFLISVYD